MFLDLLGFDEEASLKRTTLGHMWLFVWKQRPLLSSSRSYHPPWLYVSFVKVDPMLWAFLQRSLKPSKSHESDREIVPEVVEKRDALVGVSCTVEHFKIRHLEVQREDH